MTEEIIEYTALQQKLAAKEAECRELRKELHELRSHAQILQNKLALAELVLGELRRPKQHSLTDKTENPASPDA
jgi:predicted nuclease with TOPRIM domain